MKKLSVYMLVIALSAGSAATVQRAMRIQADSDTNVLIDTNGAFRDGLYLGKLAARNGEPPHIAIARWATDKDRSAFREGYERGFSQTLIDRATTED
jgi:hypothetical protein